MKKIIIANWKMNPQSLLEAKRIFNEIKKTAIKLSKVKTIICPPFPYISNLKSLGAQDLFYEEKGAYTGEISAGILKDLGVKYVIIGHSERRELGETNEIVNKKIKTALKSGLKVIMCVGEKERDSEGEYLNFIKDQINEGLKGIPRKLLTNIIIAYEPVWAISSHKSTKADNPESALRTAIFIRRMLLSIIGDQLARQVPILYGGSVDIKNAEQFLKEGGIQGLLVGSQSLIPKNFNEILKIADRIK
jgi:triosephosphate isomerase